ncbi:MAG: hypothetical protein N4A35_03645 [Flavobacteriales bacterium]|jgi:parvulin-like peptidyl-prolyl isomerase|nr:hypothetical protein [Flavobacteriales bacterium]
MQDHDIKNIIKDVFHDHPRIQKLFNDKKPGFKVRYSRLIDYAYEVAKQSKGVFVASNQKTVLLYYRTSKVKSLKSFVLYLRLIFTIKPALIIDILQEEKLIKANRLKVNDYYYAWYLAQANDYHRLDGLFEARNYIVKKSQTNKIPLLLETAKEELVNFYLKAGFELYTTVENKGIKIYFFKYLPPEV